MPFAYGYFASSFPKQMCWFFCIKVLKYFMSKFRVKVDRCIPLSLFALFCSTNQCDAMLKVRFKVICQTQGWNFHEILPIRISVPDWLDNFEISLRIDWQRLPWVGLWASQSEIIVSKHRSSAQGLLFVALPYYVYSASINRGVERVAVTNDDRQRSGNISWR